MIVSLNWLKNYVDLPSKYTPTKLAELITLHSCEVEQVIDQKAQFDKIITAKIVKIDKHPDADKLRLPTVDTGQEKITVVCGAPNIEVGQIIPFAQEGARVQHDGEYFEIKKAKIRGVESCGMLCSGRELGLSDDHSGILILPPDTPLGKNFAEVYGLDDVLIEIDNKSMTHRPDLWGYVGMAREFAAVLKTKFKAPVLKELKVSKEDTKFKVSVETPQLCPRYMGVALKKVKITESPEYIKTRLRAAGLRPINNIVDVTNYVMLELGQPVHAFDLRKLPQGEILVRKARKGEKIMLLDEKEYTLTEQNLLITDGKKAVALAGVMGGAESSIADDTTEIFLESANFQAANNRQTAAALGVRTDSSMRYEKSLDPALCEQALKRMVELIQETCPAAYLASKVFDVNNWKDPQIKLKIDAKTISKKAGVTIKEKEVKDILTRLGFSVDAKLNVKVPSWRATKDILTPIDLVEEVIRIYGYDNIPCSNPHWPLEVPAEKAGQKLAKKIRQILTSCGSFEVINYNFVGEDLIKKFKLDESEHIRLSNPLASDQSMLRTSLLPNIVLAAQRNLRFQESVSLFELGSVFLKKPGTLQKDEHGKTKLPLQKKIVTMLVTGDFYAAKKLAETVFARLGISGQTYTSQGSDICESYAKIDALGEIGTLSPQLAKEFDLPETSYFSLDLEEVEKLLPGTAKFQELAKFPAVKRDFAVLLPEDTAVGPFLESIKALAQLIVEMKLFDVYRGDKIPTGQKSVAFNLTFQDPDKTLSEEEIAKLHQQVVSKIESLGGKLRG